LIAQFLCLPQIEGPAISQRPIWFFKKESYRSRAKGLGSGAAKRKSKAGFQLKYRS
jgi:hypothetical protein